jgi:hypothetical protein
MLGPLGIARTMRRQPMLFHIVDAPTLGAHPQNTVAVLAIHIHVDIGGAHELLSLCGECALINGT